MVSRAKRFVIDVIEMVRSKDDEGQATRTPRTLYRGIRCDFKSQVGFDQDKQKEGALNSIAAPSDAVFTIRFSPRILIHNKHQILFQGETFNVVHTSNVERRKGEGGFKETEIYAMRDQNGT
jgi:hypothetical protein